MITEERRFREAFSVALVGAAEAPEETVVLEDDAFFRSSRSNFAQKPRNELLTCKSGKL